MVLEMTINICEIFDNLGQEVGECGYLKRVLLLYLEFY